MVNATLKEDYKGEAPETYDAGLTDCFDTISYTYDEKGRVTKEENSSGSVYRYAYDNSGNVLKETSTITENDKTETTVTTYTYDDMGNVLTTQCDKENASYIYDKAGRTLLSNDSGKCTRTIYDEYGRTVQEIGPEDYDRSKDGLPAENTYADKNVGQRYVYDETTGNLTSEINRLDVKTDYTYYSTGEKKQEAFDNYVYKYSKQGLLTSVELCGQLYATYEYDENANNTKVVFGNGQTVHYDYDENNNLVACSRNDEQTPYITMSYAKTDDDITYMSSKTDYDCSRITNYDKDGNITSIQTADGETVFTKSVTVSTEKTEDSDEIKETSFTQTLLDYTIDGKYSENSAAYSSGTKTLGIKTADNENSTKTEVSFNSVKRVTETSEYEDGKLVKKSTLADPSTTPYVETVEYDSQGRIVKAGNSNDKNHPRRFVYKDNRLVKDYYYHGGYAAEYQYDKRGNLISSKKYSCPANEEDEIDYSTLKENTSFDCAALEDLSTADSLINIQDTALDLDIKYDVNGNPIQYAENDLEYAKFEWTNGRQLKKISICEEPESEEWTDVAEYTYDENGIRTSMKAEGKTTYYIYEGNTLLGQYTDDGEKTDDVIMFLYDENGEIQGAQYGRGSGSPNMYYYQKDVFGNVYSIRNDLGNSIGSYLYDAYGHNFLGTSGNDYFEYINPITYRCYYEDNYFGGYYNLSRYYHSYFGRFFNLDDPAIALQSKSDPDGMNLFAYCNNDPVNKIDPDGKAATYTVTIRYYGKKGANIFGHIDISFGGIVYTYGDYEKNNIQYTLMSGNVKYYLSSKKMKGRKIRDKIYLKFSSKEYKRLIYFYGEKNLGYKRNKKYKEKNKDESYLIYRYVLSNKKYAKYNFFYCNCAKLVCNALEYALGRKFSNTLIKYRNYIKNLNTPANVAQLANYIKVEYHM